MRKRANEGILKTFIAAIDEEKNQEVDEGVHSGTLMHFHQLFGHLSYNTIERAVRDPRSGIRLTDKERVTCHMHAREEVKERAVQEGHRRAFTD